MQFIKIYEFYLNNFFEVVKGKGQVIPVTGREGP
jgi:hypothetical protein